MDHSTLSPESDALFTAARAGDVAALGRVVDGLRPYLKVIAARELGGRLADKVEDSDVVQEGLLAAVQQFTLFRGGTRAELQAWLVAIVRNNARNLLRYFRQQVRDVGR